MLPPARKAHAGIVRDERRMNVHQIEVLRLQRGKHPAQCARFMRRSSGSLGTARGHPHHMRFADRSAVIQRGIAVAGRHQHRFHTGLRQIGAKGADRGGYPVDAREVDVGDEQHPHAG